MPGPVCSETGGPLCSGIGGRFAPEYARTSVERCNGRFKDEFGGRSVQVRGPDKVMMHAMFGIVTLFADQLLKVTGW